MIEQIYKILTSKKLRRGQPLNPIEIKQRIGHWITVKQPLLLATTWLGVKTTDSGEADEVDKAALLFLKREIIDEIKKIGVEAKIKIMFADSNASLLEGYNKERINIYWQSLNNLIQDELFNDFYLESLNQKFWGGIFKLDGNETIDVKELARIQNANDLLESVELKTSDIINSENFITLIDWAKKHSLLVKNGILSPEEAAKRYLAHRIFSFLLYEKKNPYDVYFTYVEPQYHQLLTSSLPTLFIWSLHKGTSLCPWFNDEKNERFQELIARGEVNLN